MSTEIIPENVKHTIKDLRVRASMSQSAAAKKLGISEPTLRKWEDDSGILSYNDMQRVADMYHIPLDYIFLEAITLLAKKELIKMGALLELVKDSSPEDRQAVAEFLKPYLQPINTKPKVEHLLNVEEFQKQLPVQKRKDWIRNDLFERNPELKQFAFNLNAGKGRPLKISPKALDWIANHDIDWRG